MDSGLWRWITAMDVTGVVLVFVTITAMVATWVMDEGPVEDWAFCVAVGGIAAAIAHGFAWRRTMGRDK
jgi:succinate dehydrogenase hydrophobic anchor subunit